jgi:hypothetical protein
MNHSVHVSFEHVEHYEMYLHRHSMSENSAMKMLPLMLLLTTAMVVMVMVTTLDEMYVYVDDDSAMCPMNDLMDTRISYTYDREATKRKNNDRSNSLVNCSATMEPFHRRYRNDHLDN